MHACEGYSKPLASATLVACPYDASVRIDAKWFCYWCSKVYEGLITDVGGRDLSWDPCKRDRQRADKSASLEPEEDGSPNAPTLDRLISMWA